MIDTSRSSVNDMESMLYLLGQIKKTYKTSTPTFMLPVYCILTFVYICVMVKSWVVEPY